MKTVNALCLLLSLCAVAAPPAPGGGGKQEDRREEREKHHRLKLVLALSEALELNEAEAIKLSEKVRVFEDKRAPLRREMHESMKLLKDAAKGETAALAGVDSHVQRVLDNRRKMADLDKEMFNALSKELSAQKKARLAVALAKLKHAGRPKDRPHHDGRDKHDDDDR